jgi:hypothetical protein
MELDFYCFPYDPVHTSGCFGHITGVLQLDAMAKIYAVFSHPD